MSHFAKVENGIVTEILVAEQDFINTLEGTWIQTSYNTFGGQHPKGTPLRKNFAGLGYSYDTELDAFIPPKPFTSWVLNQESCLWQAPVAKPTDEKQYYWNEETTSWKEIQ
jgi:hypothetical protein